jgi:hypothetical protein
MMMVPLVISSGQSSIWANSVLIMFLRADDPFQIMVGFREKTAQPFLTPYRFCKIEFVKYRIFFFLVKNRDIVEGDFVYLHSEKSGFMVFGFWFMVYARPYRTARSGGVHSS